MKDGSTLKIMLYFTDQIKNTNQNFLGIKGLPLEYSLGLTQMGFKFTYTASSILLQPVPESMFEIPDDYKLTKLEDLGK